MEAFPAVLKEVPNARLVIAGANHHTRAGYWESIRKTQPAGLPIDFRGYVREDEIPELFRTTSIVVMPYDSATGSSGPAHQACEYGIPIVCADIADFRAMAAEEDMAIRFYNKGDAGDLAGNLISILQSPEQQRQMAEHNYAAGAQMTMAAVVRNYLRWFELKKCKRELRGSGPFPAHHLGEGLPRSVEARGLKPEAELEVRQSECFASRTTISGAELPCSKPTSKNLSALNAKIFAGEPFDR